MIKPLATRHYPTVNDVLKAIREANRSRKSLATSLWESFGSWIVSFSGWIDQETLTEWCERHGIVSFHFWDNTIVFADETDAQLCFLAFS